MLQSYFNKTSHNGLLSVYVSCELDKWQVIAVKLIHTSVTKNEKLYM